MDLKKSNPSNWWSSINNLTGRKSKGVSFDNLANEFTMGDVA